MNLQDTNQCVCGPTTNQSMANPALKVRIFQPHNILFNSPHVILGWKQWKDPLRSRGCDKCSDFESELQYLLLAQAPVNEWAVCLDSSAPLTSPAEWLLLCPLCSTGTCVCGVSRRQALSTFTLQQTEGGALLHTQWLSQGTMLSILQTQGWHSALSNKFYTIS